MVNESCQHDLKDLVETNINTLIPATIISQALGKDPFVSVPGIINLRDLGALPSSPIRRGLIYRSGTLYNLPASSLTKLKDDLEIKMILDLRTKREIIRSPDPVINGVENEHFDSLRAPTPTDLAKFVEDGGKKGYVGMCEEVLEIHKPSVKAALEWIRDEKGPLLFHCTGMFAFNPTANLWLILVPCVLAGKDRTGVLAAIILWLAGASKDVIEYDFTLTRVGIEPARELLLQMLKMWNKEWTAETPGMQEFSSIKSKFILGTLGMIEEKYGGVVGYVKGLGFSDEDLEQIGRVLKGD